MVLYVKIRTLGVYSGITDGPVFLNTTTAHIRRAFQGHAKLNLHNKIVIIVHLLLPREGFKVGMQSISDQLFFLATGDTHGRYRRCDFVNAVNDKLTHEFSI